MEKKAVSLYEALGQIKVAMKTYLPHSWWITGEISEIKVNYSGHCYLELIEKEESGESIKAKARATIWSSAFRMIQPYFETTTQTQLAAGIKIMVKVSAEFHELYGFSLNITDIEPSFTIGDLARQKLEIVRRLKAEGVYDMNRNLTFPDIPQKIAVISSKTAAGYGDFINQLTRNPYGYYFDVRLFQTVMQGQETEQSVIRALDEIYALEELFDVVVIIRGGGSQTDLNSFNSYWLNLNICQFPLPVLTGIGHEQDDTIADMVAHKRLKTPTAVAEFLIGCFSEADEEIGSRSMNLYNLVKERVQAEKDRLNRAVMLLKPAVTRRLEQNRNQLVLKGMKMKSMTGRLLQSESNALLSISNKMGNLISHYLKNATHKLEMLDKKKQYLDPFHILKRGYSITYYQGKVVKNAAMLKTDDEIETKLSEGTIKSRTL